MDKAEAVAAAHGWKAAFRERGSLTELAEHYAEFDVRTYFAKEFNWTFAAEFDRLTKEEQALNQRLNAATAPKVEDAAPAEASTRVVALKHALHEKQEQVEVLRRQIAAQGSLLATTQARVRSASDLARLKRSNVGFLEHAECPTCRNVVDPERFELKAQTAEEIDAYIESAKRDEEALRSATHDATFALNKLLSEVRETEQQYVLAQRALRKISDANNPVAEAVAALSSRVVAIEREIDRAKQLEEQLTEVQKELDAWLAEVEALSADEVDDKKATREKKVVAQFEETFKDFLARLGHGDAEKQLDAVSLDERYVPMMGKRRLRSVGSASDQPRVVLAYAWALLEASLKNEGWHPGFLFADEPLQQNPDEPHRRAWCEFVAAKAKNPVGQTIILTYLAKEDLAYLKEQKVNVVELPTGYLLRTD